MSRAPSITVFVRKIGAQYVAESFRHDATDLFDPKEAACKCVAQVLGTAPHLIDIIPDNDHVFIGVLRRHTVKVPHPPVNWGNLFACLAIVALSLASMYLAWRAGR